MSAVAAVFLHEKIMMQHQIIYGVFKIYSEKKEMNEITVTKESQRSVHIGVIRQVDEIFIGAARFLLCCVGVSAKKKAGESKDSLAFLNFAIIRW